MGGTALNASGDEVLTTPVCGFPLPKLFEDRTPPPISGGRYSLPPYRPGETKNVRLSRISTIAKTLDDTYMLELWKQRMVLKGLTDDEQMFPRLMTARDALDSITDPAARKSKMRTDYNEIAEHAMHAAGTERANEHGTAVHDWAAFVDLGGSIADVPDMFRPAIEQYQLVLIEHGLVPIPEFIERTVVNGGYGFAGTLDRVYGTRTGHFVLGDIKTSARLDYSWLSFAVQLAGYHGAKLMLNNDGISYSIMPPLLYDVAMLIHIPRVDVEGGDPPPVAAVPVDMTFGHEALELSYDVYQIRKRAKEAKFTQMDTRPELLPAAELDAMIRAHIADARCVQDIIDIAGSVPWAWTPEYNTLAQKRADALQKHEVDAMLNSSEGAD